MEVPTTHSWQQLKFRRVPTFKVVVAASQAHQQSRFDRVAHCCGLLTSVQAKGRLGRTSQPLQSRVAFIKRKINIRIQPSMVDHFIQWQHSRHDRSRWVGAGRCRKIAEAAWDLDGKNSSMRTVTAPHDIFYSIDTASLRSTRVNELISRPLKISIVALGRYRPKIFSPIVRMQR